MPRQIARDRAAVEHGPDDGPPEDDRAVVDGLVVGDDAVLETRRTALTRDSASVGVGLVVPDDAIAHGRRRIGHVDPAAVVRVAAGQRESVEHRRRIRPGRHPDRRPDARDTGRIDQRLPRARAADERDALAREADALVVSAGRDRDRVAVDGARHRGRNRRVLLGHQAQRLRVGRAACEAEEAKRRQETARCVHGLSLRFDRFDARGRPGARSQATRRAPIADAVQPAREEGARLMSRGSIAFQERGKSCSGPDLTSSSAEFAPSSAALMMPPA